MQVRPPTYFKRAGTSSFDGFSRVPRPRNSTPDGRVLEWRLIARLSPALLYEVRRPRARRSPALTRCIRSVRSRIAMGEIASTTPI